MAKDLTDYDYKYENDITSFTELDAIDYIRTLRKQKNYDKAIEVAEAFKINCRGLSGYNNDYAWALYYKFVSNNDADPQLAEKTVNDILAMTTQSPYSPYDAALNRLIRIEMAKEDCNYSKVLELLGKLDRSQLSKEEFTTKDGRKVASNYERYMKQLAKAQFETGKYQACLRTIEDSYAQISHFHGGLYDLRIMHVECQIKLGHNEAALKEFLSMKGHNSSITNESLYNMYIGLNDDATANAFLLDDIYNMGFSKDHIHLYEKLKNTAHKANYPKLEALVDELLEAFKEDEAKAGRIYDDMMDELTRNLNKIVNRTQGKIARYNEEKKLGNIQAGGDSIFFMEADYIYEEEIKRFDIVEFTELPTYDRKKDEISSKAILIEFISED